MTMIPDWTKYVRVDVVIECYPVPDPVVRALLEAMPDAYGGTPPGEDDWPEPDRLADQPYMLARVWTKLDEDVRTTLEAARKQALYQHYRD